jgi:hypothetical protein
MTITIETPPVTHTTWRQVAGPELSPRSFRFATVPDGPQLDGWSGGEVERIETKNRQLLTQHFARLAAAPIGPRGLPPAASDPGARAVALIASISADLSIPDFLRRTS